MNSNPPDLPNAAIAIIGLSGRFPGANNVPAFWKNLCEGVESVNFFTTQELLDAGVDAELLNHPAYVKAQALLDNVEDFAASFFGVTLKEAELTDPQHRIFMECAWEALEDAGHTPEGCSGKTAVFAGAGLNMYLMRNLASHPQLLNAMGALQLVINNRGDFMPTKVSYKLNLTGPSVNVNTACSSSLVAVHMACRSLLNFESDMALAGGAGIGANEKCGYLYQSGGVMSPDGHCRVFDAQAQGTVSGNGAGVVLLKRLEDAVADGDAIYAVIRGSAVNNDGAQKVGYTAPSVEGQKEVIALALAMAEVAPHTIGYVEAHGTATPMGDPIEVNALTQAFNLGASDLGTAAQNFCAIGSVKSNIGHLDAAAGVAGLIKTALCLKHRTLVPSLNFEAPNPAMQLQATPFFVNTQRQAWQPTQAGMPLRAGVSSFGIGGTNAHVVLEEAPPSTSTPSLRKWQLLVLSAQTESALSAATANLQQFLQNTPQCNTADMAYTLQVGRRAFAHRRMVLCHATGDARQALVRSDRAFSRSGLAQEATQASGAVFMFPGMGDQYLHMAAGLYEDEAFFRDTVNECAQLLQPLLGVNLLELLYPQDPPRSPQRNDATDPGQQPTIDLRKMLGRTPAPDEPHPCSAWLNETRLVHPVLFTIEYALAQMLRHYGVHPKAMIGHSLGEYVAACVAGVMTLPEALTLVAGRARLIQALPEGRMLAVASSEPVVSGLLSAFASGAPNAGLSMAALNGPHMTVVAGPKFLVRDFEAQLKKAGLAYLPVQSSHAFHSTMMLSIQVELKALFQPIKLQAPTIPYVSNLTGRWITPEQAVDANYWVQHTCQPVRFAQGLATLLGDGDGSRTFIEVGPGQTLASFLQQSAVARGLGDVLSLPSLPGMHEDVGDGLVLAQLLGTLWCQGQTITWAQLYEGEKRQRLSLPTYPFERERCWIAPAAANFQTAAFAAAPQTAMHAQVAANVEPVAPQQPGLHGAKRPVYMAPETEIEQQVALFWQELLGTQHIGLDDNFFHLGGNSLLAVQFISRITEHYQIQISLKHFFHASTVRDAATVIETILLGEINALSDDEAAQYLQNNPQNIEGGDVLALESVPYTLPNQCVIEQFNTVETDHFYHDIFESKVYASHGVQIEAGAVVFDVGANVGLFSLFAHQQAADVRIYAFEPAPPIFKALQKNLQAHGVNAQAFMCGVANAARTETLTFYPQSTGMSSFHADKQEEQDVLRAIMQNQLDQGMPGMQQVMAHADDILEARFAGQPYECEIVTLSQVIRQHHVPRIDLLKIDVQKSELQVIEGLDDEHWPLIRQLVIEVHDLGGRVQHVRALLERQGFYVTVVQELLYRTSSISNLYATRDAAGAGAKLK
jgi:phthiocerol/phenolphthiocerol synthesis type-I polyketide synthase E